MPLAFASTKLADVHGRSRRGTSRTFLSSHHHKAKSIICELAHGRNQNKTSTSS